MESLAGEKQASVAQLAEHYVANVKATGSSPVTRSMENITVDDLADVLIGLQLETATSKAEELGFKVRVTAVDGKALMHTADYDPNRVNVGTVDNVVDTIYVG